MPSNVCVPFFKPGEDITGYLSQNIEGKRFVKPVGPGRGSQPRIALAGAGDPVCGVLGQDGLEGEFIHFHVAGTVPVVAAADIAAGVRVQSDLEGRAVILGTGVPVGITTAPGTAGGSVPVMLNLG